MKYLIIGDVHGCFEQLGCYVKYFDQVDKVISVGDLMDRGEDSLACMKLMSSVENAITLIGNHEWKYYTAFKKGNTDFIPRDVDPHKKMEFWDILLKLMYQYGQPRLRFYRDENLLVSHAPGALWQHDLSGTDMKNNMVYGVKKDERDEKGYKIVVTPFELFNGEVSIKPLVYGHIHMPCFKIRENEYCVDWDAGKGGPLAALLFENDVVVSAFLDGREVSIENSLL